MQLFRRFPQNFLSLLANQLASSMIQNNLPPPIACMVLLPFSVLTRLLIVCPTCLPLQEGFIQHAMDSRTTSPTNLLFATELEQIEFIRDIAEQSLHSFPHRSSDERNIETTDRQLNSVCEIFSELPPGHALRSWTNPPVFSFYSQLPLSTNDPSFSPGFTIRLTTTMISHSTPEQHQTQHQNQNQNKNQNQHQHQTPSRLHSD